MKRNFIKRDIIRVACLSLILFAAGSCLPGFSSDVATSASHNASEHKHSNPASGQSDPTDKTGSSKSKDRYGPAESYPSLQAIIDLAKPGDQLTLTEPAYAGPVVITKQLTLTAAAGIALINDRPQSAIVIQAEGVVLEQLAIRHRAFGETGAAVQVEADGVTLRGLSIHTRGSGILLRGADQGVVENNQITWDSSQGVAAMGQKGNAIDLFQSNNSRITANRITAMRDGIYLDNSKALTIQDNHVSGSRYAIHCMYIDGTQLIGNTSEYNVTGAMIMGVRNVRVEGNTFTKQKDNVNSQGILLYDVKDSVLTDNAVEGNRVGLYLEDSSGNELMHNNILRNFIGIQFVDSEDNRLTYNDFVANVIEAEATGSENNQLRFNYWDSAEVLDLDRDGTSELAYAINPFYQRLVAETPAYQLFFQSPGIRFLGSMYESDRTGWTTDQSPQVKPHSPLAAPPTDPSVPTIPADQRQLPEKTFMLLIAGILLLMTCTTIFYSRGAKA